MCCFEEITSYKFKIFPIKKYFLADFQKINVSKVIKMKRINARKTVSLESIKNQENYSKKVIESFQLNTRNLHID